MTKSHNKPILTPGSNNWQSDLARTKETRDLVWSGFNRDDLARICGASEHSFGDAYEMERVETPTTATSRHWIGDEDFYFFKDNGSDTLFVAHLDTVVWPEERAASFAESEAGLVVHSGALDDRLGAYVGLELLPRLGIKHDWLLTVGEESGRSTAGSFTASKDYDWIIEFDRGGTDVVMYEYEDADTRAAVRACGARVGQGSFSDICYLENLGIKGFNWGVGYTGDYHSTRGYAFLDDTVAMVARYLEFHAANVGKRMPHEKKRRPAVSGSGYRWTHGGWEWEAEEEDDFDKAMKRADAVGAEAEAEKDSGLVLVDKEVEVLGLDSEALAEAIEDYTGKYLGDLDDDEASTALAEMISSGWLANRIAAKEVTTTAEVVFSDAAIITAEVALSDADGFEAERDPCERCSKKARDGVSLWCRKCRDDVAALSREA